MTNLYYQSQAEIEKDYPDISPEEKREMITKKLKEKVSKTVETLVDTCNTIGMQDTVRAGILEGIIRSHRYLQNEFFIALFDVMKRYGETEWDLRNKWAVEACKKASKAVES
jgi:hypothetical protein